MNEIYLTGDLVREIETGALGIVVVANLSNIGNCHDLEFYLYMVDIIKSDSMGSKPEIKYSCKMIPGEKHMSKYAWFERGELELIERGAFFKYMSNKYNQLNPMSITVEDDVKNNSEVSK